MSHIPLPFLQLYCFFFYLNLHINIQSLTEKAEFYTNHLNEYNTLE